MISIEYVTPAYAANYLNPWLYASLINNTLNYRIFGYQWNLYCIYHLNILVLTNFGYWKSAPKLKVIYFILTTELIYFFDS